MADFYEVRILIQYWKQRDYSAKPKAMLSTELEMWTRNLRKESEFQVNLRFSNSASRSTGDLV